LSFRPSNLVQSSSQRLSGRYSSSVREVRNSEDEYILVKDKSEDETLDDTKKRGDYQNCDLIRRGAGKFFNGNYLLSAAGNKRKRYAKYRLCQQRLKSDPLFH